MYVATKHAVKGYTDCLRMEVEEVDKAPVSITLIQPGATDTPFPQHARNVTDKEPKLRFTAEAGSASKPIRLTLVGTKIARPVVATLADFDATTADLWLTVGPNATVAPPTPKKK